MQDYIQFGKVGVGFKAFTVHQKKAFIGLLISGGVRGDFEGKWKEYKQAQKEFKKFK
tara:strand:+ start:441 stop:611 length:171 start_codon:yes stop_codon:yes gene_type:complete